jgi:histidinol-phosphatase (PHP family)
MAVTIGSDAHRPEEIGRHFERTFEMLQAAGMSTLAVFTGRRRSETPIPFVPLSLQ